MAEASSDFIIEDGVLKKYVGSDRDIEIPEGVTCIAQEAFVDALLAKSIRFPSSLKKVESHVLALHVYGYDYKLEKVIAPSLEAWLSIRFEDESSNFLSVAENLYFGDGLVTEVTIPGSVKKVPAYSFTGCHSLKKVIVEEGVIALGEGCFSDTNIEEITLPQSLTSLCENNRYFSFSRSPFRFCDELQRIEIPPKVTEIPEDCFRRCGSLREIVLPEGLNRIGSGAFSSCDSLEELVLPSTVEEIAISGMEHLKKLVLPKGLKTLGQIRACPELEELIIPDSVTKMDSIEGMDSLRRLRVPNGIEYEGRFQIGNRSPYTNRRGESDIPNLEYNRYGNGLYVGNEDNPYVVFVSVEDPEAETVTLHGKTHCIASYAFSECPNLKTVTLPRSIAWIARDAFHECPNLESVIPEDQGIRCEMIFSKCPKASIDLGLILDRPLRLRFHYGNDAGSWDEEATLTFSDYYVEGHYAVDVRSRAHYVLADGMEVDEEYSSKRSLRFEEAFVLLEELLESKRTEGISIAVTGFDDEPEHSIFVSDETFASLYQILGDDSRIRLGIDKNARTLYAVNRYSLYEPEELEPSLALARKERNRLRTTMILAEMQKNPPKPKPAPKPTSETVEDMEDIDDDMPF